MRRQAFLSLAVLSVVGFTASGCGAMRQLGGARTTPDEFRVVTKAPLVLPPEYGLRPPAPGEPRAQELAPESAARNALLGQRAAITRSQGEQLLVAKAGGERADPLIRFVVDDEFGDVAHKEKGFVDRVLFWRKDQPAASPADAPATPVDAAAEQTRITALTGGQPVVIQRERRSRFKLPGL